MKKTIGDFATTSDNSWNIALEYKGSIFDEVITSKKFRNISRRGYLYSEHEVAEIGKPIEIIRRDGFMRFIDSLTDLIDEGLPVMIKKGNKDTLARIRGELKLLKDVLNIEGKLWETSRNNISNTSTLKLTPKFDSTIEIVVDHRTEILRVLNDENLIFPNTKTLDRKAWKEALNERFVHKG